MIREEQIQQATAVYQAKLLGQGYTPLAADNCADGFYEGAVWADAKPRCWHKCEDEMPESNVVVLAVAKSYKSNFHYVGYYDAEDECWYADINDGYIHVPTVAWTELPQPPKFD